MIKSNANASAPSDKKRFGCFDTEFVISEVNTNYSFWVRNDVTSDHRGKSCPVHIVQSFVRIGISYCVDGKSKN